MAKARAPIALIRVMFAVLMMRRGGAGQIICVQQPWSRSRWAWTMRTILQQCSGARSSSGPDVSPGHWGQARVCEHCLHWLWRRGWGRGMVSLYITVTTGSSCHHVIMSSCHTATDSGLAEGLGPTDRGCLAQAMPGSGSGQTSWARPGQSLQHPPPRPSSPSHHLSSLNIVIITLSPLIITKYCHPPEWLIGLIYRLLPVHWGKLFTAKYQNIALLFHL